MQKVTYFLLQRHANIYWQTKRNSEIISVITPPKRRRRPVTICVFSKSKEPLPGMEDVVNSQKDFNIAVHSHLHFYLKKKLRPYIFQIKKNWKDINILGSL
ncbi:unnamed protein product [Rhizopus stolonifer]